MDDIIDWLTLSQLPGVGVTGFWSIERYFGGPSAALRGSTEALLQIPGIGKKQCAGFEKKAEVRDACIRQLRHLEQMSAFCLCYEDDYYPANLKEISDPPPVLYGIGSKTVLRGKFTAVVGSRASTRYGSRVAFSLAKNLAESGVTVVSGLALGIDTEAHRGALAGGGWTIAVLGCGIDVRYPRQNSSLFEDIAKRGVIVSEYPLGTSPEGFRFPARNRIIAGMSSGVVVVEAAKKSGSLITAQLALDEGRNVYAVPGQVDSYKSEGTHWLLKQGAKLVQTENDILEDLALQRADGAESAEVAFPQHKMLEPVAQQLLQILDAYPLSRDVLIEKSGRPVSEISEMLLLLELEGYIEVLPGDQICRLQ